MTRLARRLDHARMGKKRPLWAKYKIVEKRSSYLVDSEGKIVQRIPTLERGIVNMKLKPMSLLR